MNLGLSIKTICSIIDADFIDKKGFNHEVLIKNLVIDSRSPLINESTLFVLFKGNKTNGAKFIPEFEKKGGQFIITNQRISNSNIGQFIVSDPLRALQLIASYHRKKFTIPVIGITGSNGKTTVKEWLYHVLKFNYSIVRSPKSYNSQIGVALSVLEMDKNHELAIFEAGISKPNEMLFLEEMIQPTIGVFTGIGDAHNGGFNSTDIGLANPEIEKQKEKYILFRSVTTLIEIKKGILKKAFNKINSSYQLIAEKNEIKLVGLSKTESFTIPFSNLGSTSNAGLVYLTAQIMGLKNTELKMRLNTLPSISMRLEKLGGINGNLLINDAYNLDEKSLEIGVQFLDANKSNKPTVIFIAEDYSIQDDSASILSVLKRIKAQINIDRVVYFGSKVVSKAYPFIEKQYASFAEFKSNPIEINNSVILFTGTRSSHLETIVNVFAEKKHITRLHINLMAIRNNLNVFREKIAPKTKILAMVKAQSYGGGILEVAQFLAQENISYFGVAYADEGVLLRKGGIEQPILVMNPEPAAFDDIIDYGLEPSIYSLALLNKFIHQLILRQKTNFAIHIKLDTGMNRLGFRKEELTELVEMLATQPEVFVQSVFSHLSVADNANESAYTTMQIEQFKLQANQIEKAIGYSFIRHLANSAGAYHHPNSEFDMVRLGIGLFGLLSEKTNAAFDNVFQLRSKISQIRRINKGESVGYNRSFIANKDTIIGIVPIGYADGLSRGLGGGKWSVIIQDKMYPIIGNICMDMCFVNLGTNAEINVGEEVELFGEKNTVFKISKVLNTIPYEVISSISARVQRVYLDE